MNGSHGSYSHLEFCDHSGSVPKAPPADETQRYINISTTLFSVMMGGGRALTPAPECAGHGVTGLLSMLLRRLKQKGHEFKAYLAIE